MINAHFENLGNQNENITHFEYEPFDRYDLQGEENNDTTTPCLHPEENIEYAENYEHAHQTSLLSGLRFRTLN